MENKQINPQAVITEKTTATLGKILAKTVEKNVKGRDVEDVVHEEKFVI